MISIPLWFFILLIFLSVPMVLFIITLLCVLICLGVSDIMDNHTLKVNNKNRGD